jgi:hypothetical protein
MTWYIRLAILAAYSLILIVATWEVQNWRWEAKQLAAVQVSQQFHDAEEKIGASADTKFQTQKGKTDATFKKIDDQVNKQAVKPSTSCFDPVSLQLVNSALARKATAARRSADPLPAPPGAQ